MITGAIISAGVGLVYALVQTIINRSKKKKAATKLYE